MNVEQAHEDAYHKPTVVEISVFLDFLDDHDASVGRCHDNVVGVFLREIANRTTEKVDHNAIDDSEDSHENPEGNLRV